MRKLKLELGSFVKRAVKVSADIGSENHYILMRHPDGRSVKVFCIKNNRAGFDYLNERIEEQKTKWNIKDVAFGMESTGNYNDGIGGYLVDKGISVVLVNGYHTKRIKEISDNSPLKSDSKDPYVICDLMELGHVMNYWKPVGPVAEIRQLNIFREKIVKKRIIDINQIKDALVSLFPEFEKTVGSVKSKTTQYLIRNSFHDPDTIKNADCDLLAQNIRKISRGRKGIKTVQALIQASNETIGVKEGKNVMIRSIIWLAEEIAKYDKEMDLIEEDMSKQLEEIEYTKYLLSINGIGLITVAGIVGEIGDFDRFNNIKEIEKYAGLNLYEISSGKFKGQKRITKRGRCYLRKVLYLGALSQVRCNPPMKEWYEKMKNNGKNNISGLIAVSRKLLRLCYGIVKSKSYYNMELWRNKADKAA